MIRKLMMSAALALIGTAVSAAVSTDVVVQSLSAQGFTRVEVKRGLSQIKVKAIRGDEKLDLVLDGATGRILKQSMARTMFLDNKTPGFFVSERQRDFLNPDAAAPASRSDRQASATPSALIPAPAPAAGHVGAAMAVRVTEDYVGPAIDDGSAVADEETAGTDVQIDDGAFIGIVAGDYFPIQAIDADGDGLADPIKWDDDGIITIDDGWVWTDDGQGDTIDEPDPNGGDVVDGDPGTDEEWVDGSDEQWVDGSDEEWVDGSDDGWVDGSDDTWVEDGTGQAGEDIVLHIMPHPMPPIYVTDPASDGEPATGDQTDGTDSGSDETDPSSDEGGDAAPDDAALQ